MRKKLTFYFCVCGLFSFFFRVQEERYSIPKLNGFPTLSDDRIPKFSSQKILLGRYLFYDPILSHDSDISCSSCHRQNRAFSYVYNHTVDGYSASKIKTTRSVSALINIMWLNRLFWDGRAKSLEEQILQPIRSDMRSSWLEVGQRLARSAFYSQHIRKIYGPNLTDSLVVVDALAQFVSTLISYNSKFDRVLAGKDTFSPIESTGYQLFLDRKKANCVSCHYLTAGEPLADLMANNGLQNGGRSQADTVGFMFLTGSIADCGKFRIPTLRNLTYTSPYMHNNRFNDLKEVIEFYSEGITYGKLVDARIIGRSVGGAHFNTDQKAALLAFLYTLTDTIMLKEPKFSNPYKAIK